MVRRTAGVRPRSSSGGLLSGAGLKDDPLVFTGGGVTELLLDLLFDVSLSGSPPAATDVRTLTRPLFELAEGEASSDGVVEPPIVRFVWGKSWNVPGVVTAVAERLEQFSTEGEPQRSWLRMRLVRVSEPDLNQPAAPPLSMLPEDLNAVSGDLPVHEVIGGGKQGVDGDEEASQVEGDASAERLDEIALRKFGDSRLWRAIASFNGVDNPLDVPAGTLLRIPPASALQSSPPQEAS